MGRGVIYAARLPDFGLLFYYNSFLSLLNRPPKELFIDLAENIGRQGRKDVGAFRIVEVIEDVPQELVVDRKTECEFIRRLLAVLLRFEVKQP